MSFETNEPQPYESDAELGDVLRDFETCAVAPDHFKHRQHLIVALLYLRDAPVSVALERIRANLFRFLRHHGVEAQVYHETITLFWLKRVRAFLDRQDPRSTLADSANRLLEAFPDSSLIYKYYTKERLDSDEARNVWLEPDLQPLE
ncbi:MAG TPA: hypothetical protein VNA19_13455 [Pyrinomonadaceae bacterium]|jgi:hypothetical protein|nr:hypothetical protein [Pyrinomonadaceae bacterium]